MPVTQAEVVESINPADTLGANVVISPASAMGKEMAKYEQFPQPWAPRPGNPYAYREYPMMVYRAQRHPRTGQVTCLIGEPMIHNYREKGEYDQAVREAQFFNRSATLIVRDEVEFSRAMEGGWRTSPDEAVEFAMSRERQAGDAAAERNWRDRNMSDAAKAEVAVVETAAGARHLPEIPEAPKRRGRPPKVEPQG